MSRNTFDLSHTVKLTGKMGQLIPLGCFEVLPSDHFKSRAALDIRFQALLRPLMHNIKYTVHYWFVPTRLIWSDWEQFITGGEDGTAQPVSPYITTDGTNNAVGTLMDYMGIPTGVSGLQVSALPFRAYNLIFNDWYRNENLRNKYNISLSSGADTTTDLSLKRRTWKPNDYFTNALPFLQRGVSPILPLDGSAPVVGNGQTLGLTDGNYNLFLTNRDLNGLNISHTGNNYKLATMVDNRQTSSKPVGYDTGSFVASDQEQFNSRAVGVSDEAKFSGLKVDFSQGAYGMLVTTLRNGLGVQQLFEKLARSGARMVEVITSAWKIRSSDARLQRPEFLGGGSRPIVVSQVLQTSATENNSTPQANPAGFAQSLSVTPQFNKAFEEWGYIIPILSVMPQSDYMQGLAKMWTRQTRFDYAWPDLAHVGDQAIYNREIFAQGTSADSQIFGYTPRYEEYRKQINRVCGQFKTSLNFWHLARIFNNLPTLSDSFVECTPDESRVFAVSGEDNLLVECLHEMYATRSLPKYGNPGLNRV